MEQTYLQGLMDWISAHPHWAGLAIFLIAFVESLVMVGFLLPGIFILFGVGAMIGMGVTGWGPIWLGGSLGAFCGDLVSFAVGQHYRLQLRRMWPFSRYPAMLQRGVDFFRKHGAKSVLAGRFIGPLRPVIPTTAGMLGMPLRRFLAVCIPPACCGHRFIWCRGFCLVRRWMWPPSMPVAWRWCWLSPSLSCG